ncbi:MAG: class I adenylate-forming enzyme family protein [Desulfurivibrio sp.]|nr:class I adenylate-forming enzyme family protein [Desulfurivibrio sp.]
MDTMSALSTDQFASFPELLASVAARNDVRPFLTVPESNSSFTYGEIFALWRQGAAFLQTQGVHSGDRVILSLHNGQEYVVALGALFLAGAVPVLINPGASPHQLEELARLCNVSVSISSQRLEGLAHYDDTYFSSAIPQETDHAPTEVTKDRKDLAYIVFTSGSTGMMKGTQITHENMLVELGSLARAYRLTAQDSHLCVLPLFHSSALYRNFLLPYFLGAETVVMREFDASSFWKLIKTYRISFVQVVPTILSLLLESAASQKPRIGSTLKFVGTASAPCPVELVQKFEGQFQVPVIEGYGLTETTCGATLNPPTREERRLGSIGHPIDVACVEIVNEDGDVLLPNQEGEIRISGPLVSVGYINPADQEKSALVSGVILTGDLGYKDSDGFVYIIGRKTDMIYRGGFKISPKEVEGELVGHPDIEFAVVFSVPHEILGEDIVAYVLPKTGSTFHEGAVREFLSGQLINYKIPTRIYAVPELIG